MLWSLVIRGGRCFSFIYRRLRWRQAAQLFTPPLDQSIDFILCILPRTLETLIPYRVLLIPFPVDQVRRSFTQVGFASIFIIQID